MSSVLYHFLFLIFSIFTLLKVIGYALYEIQTLKNKSGGIVIIIFSILVVLFSNIMVFLY